MKHNNFFFFEIYTYCLIFETLMCQNSLCVFFWLIWLSAPSVKFEQAKDNKNDEVRSHHQDHHKKRDATQESTWFNRAVGMYFILEGR